MDPVIQTHELGKTFGGKPAVDRLSLAVPRGSVFALLGENGAGKTTTIRMLTGLLRPDRGSATILGQDCWRAAVRLRHRVGYVPERPRFYDWMTVSEIGWFTAGFYRPGFLDRYVQLTGRFQLDPRARLKELSKGQYAKVGLALALAPDPEVLILDEPTSGLDLLVRREFLGSIVDLAAEGRTILVSSHQVAEVERVASHVAFIDAGKLLLVATVEEMRQQLVRLDVRCETRPPDTARLGTVLRTEGAGNHWRVVVRHLNREAVAALRAAEGVSDVEEMPLSLEEAYLALLAGKEGSRGPAPAEEVPL